MQPGATVVFSGKANEVMGEQFAGGSEVASERNSRGAMGMKKSFLA